MARPKKIAPPRADNPTGAYRWRALTILMLVYACHMLDRTVVNVVLEPVRSEFGLSDTELGLLSGLVYGLAFSAAGIPIGMLIDRTNRRNLLAAILMIWSSLTALAGFAQSYLALLVARMGVATAESGGAPTAMSMISDLFSPRERATAIGLFYASTGLGTFLSFLVGGLIAADWGWRAVFFVAGAPGLILALAVVAFVREPPRGAFDDAPGPAPGAAPRLAEVLAALAGNAPLLAILSCAVLLALVASSMGGWTVSLLIRSHGFTLAQAGPLYALAAGAFGSAGAMGLGYVADRMAQRDPRWPLRIVQLACLWSLIWGFCFLYAPMPWAVAAMMLCNITLVGFVGPLFGLVLTLSPLRMRGTIMAILVVLSNLMGYGAGPFLTGLLSDAYGGARSLQPALATILLVNGLAAALLWIPGRAGALGTKATRILGRGIAAPGSD